MTCSTPAVPVKQLLKCKEYFFVAYRLMLCCTTSHKIKKRIFNLLHNIYLQYTLNCVVIFTYRNIINVDYTWSSWLFLEKQRPFYWLSPPGRVLRSVHVSDAFRIRLVIVIVIVITVVDGSVTFHFMILVQVIVYNNQIIITTLSRPPFSLSRTSIHSSFFLPFFVVVVVVKPLIWPPKNNKNKNNMNK